MDWKSNRIWQIFAGRKGGNGNYKQEPISLIIFVEFLDYFGLFSIPSLGGEYTNVDMPPKHWVENRLKRTEKSTETY